MTDQATEIEKAVSKGKTDRLKGIKEREGSANVTGNLFWIVLVIGVVAIAVLAIAAIKFWL
jgi:hypothetical protein